MKNTQTNKGKIRNGVIAAALAGCMVAGGAMAYLTATETKVNNFELTSGTDFTISVDEGGWNEENAKDVLPLDEIVKEPTITNTSGTDIYAFAEVKMPVYGEENADLFTMNTIDTTKWTLASTSDVVDGYRTYVYYLNNTLADQASATLFNSVTVANYDSSVVIETTHIDVTMSAIQAAHLDDASAALAAYQAQA